MASKTFAITRTAIMGTAIALLTVANIAIKGEASIFNWMSLSGGIGLVILSLIAKKLGRTNA